MQNKPKVDQRPHDGIYLMEMVARAAAVCLIIVLAFAMVGTWDYADALIAEATSKEARGAAATVGALSHPLPYAATVTQSGDGIKEPRTRFYVPTSAK
jgi:hypothetical protein